MHKRHPITWSDADNMECLFCAFYRSIYHISRQINAMLTLLIPCTILTLSRMNYFHRNRKSFEDILFHIIKLLAEKTRVLLITSGLFYSWNSSIWHSLQVIIESMYLLRTILAWHHPQNILTQRRWVMQICKSKDNKDNWNPSITQWNATRTIPGMYWSF